MKPERIGQLTGAVTYEARGVTKQNAAQTAVTGNSSAKSAAELKHEEWLTWQEETMEKRVVPKAAKAARCPEASSYDHLPNPS